MKKVAKKKSTTPLRRAFAGGHPAREDYRASYWLPAGYAADGLIDIRSTAPLIKAAQ